MTAFHNLRGRGGLAAVRAVVGRARGVAAAQDGVPGGVRRAAGRRRGPPRGHGRHQPPAGAGRGRAQVRMHTQKILQSTIVNISINICQAT